MPRPKAPGQSKRKGISLKRLADLFPDEKSARRWFESRIWPNGRCCPRCQGTRTREVPNEKPMPYWCTDCRKYFSVKIGTVMQCSKLSYRDWIYAIYLHITSLKGVSSMKLHRDLEMRQDTAWFLLQRIRKAFDDGENEDINDLFGGPVEVDESYFGGKEKNRRNSEKTFNRGTQGKFAVVGIKDRKTGKIRAQVVTETTTAVLQEFVLDNTKEGATVYTDENAAYKGLKFVFKHETVKHSVAEYVREQAHINGMESFWAVLKRAMNGVYHQYSGKHLHRYVADFAGRHDIRRFDTMAQMSYITVGMVGKRLRYKTLIA